MFRLLVQEGPDGLTVGTIAERIDVTGATLSFHLKELANAGLIVPRQEGRFIHDSADYAAMSRLMDFLTENCCQGQDCEPACRPAVRTRRKFA